jgi:hypothetical protein
MKALRLRGESSVARAMIAVGLGVVLVSASMTAAFGVASGTSYMPCLTGHTGAHVTYTLGGPGITPAISSVTVSHLSGAGCNDSPVVAVLRGNPAGSDGAPVDETLTTLNSRLDPCTQSPLAKPLVVKNATITLQACASGGPARFADLHDVTQIQLKVRGRAVTGVLGEKHHRGGGHGLVIPPLGGPTTALPFTGSWAALTFWVGFAAIVSGLLLLVAARRRRRRYQPADAG